MHHDTRVAEKCPAGKRPARVRGSVLFLCVVDLTTRPRQRLILAVPSAVRRSGWSPPGWERG